MVVSSMLRIAFVVHTYFLSGVHGHGWLVSPPSRNAQANHNNGYCPQCGNGAGICGDGGQWPSDSNYVDFYDGPQRTFAPGEIVVITITLTAHHKGHFEFNLCDKRVDSISADAQACLNSKVLKRVPPEESYGDCVPNDARGDCQPYMESQAERWYLPPGTGTYTMRFRLPDDVQCESCTLQWRWWTANSCVPKANYGCWFDAMAQQGWDKAAWCGAFCGDCGPGSTDNVGCGEEFRNCADIAITGAVVPGPSPSPAPSTTPSAMASTTTTGALPAPSPPPAIGVECVSHELLMCINGKSTYWPACDPAQTKSNEGPSGYEYGYYCTEAWTAALNEMLADPLVGKCGDTEAIHKMLAQIAYETGFYSTVYQPIDGGAGLIHMIPQNWEVNAADMDSLWPGQNYVEEAQLEGELFFQSPLYGWRSVAAWFKLTNGVIPGCGNDLFDEPFEVQTQCILGRVVSRDEAYDIVGACINEVGMPEPEPEAEPETEPEPEAEPETEPEPEAEPETEPEPEAEPETEPPAPSTPVPTPSPISPSPSPQPGTDCVAAPGLNRGVSDSDCQRCETGYQWWPCNDDALCTCSGRAAPAPNPSPSSGCFATPGLNNGVTDSTCKRCETGYQWWPCNDNLCTCSSP